MLGVSTCCSTVGLFFIGKWNKAHMWLLLRPQPCDSVLGWLSRPARHAASVRSRPIMKNQPSAGAAAEATLSTVQRAFLPRPTGSSADRWIKATTQLFLSLNGEENGMCGSPLRLYALANYAVRIVVTGLLSGRSSEACCLLHVRSRTEISEAVWRVVSHAGCAVKTSGSGPDV